jgi:hypothetical protein
MNSLLMRALIIIALVLGLSAVAEAAYRRVWVATYPSYSWSSRVRVIRGRHGFECVRDVIGGPAGAANPAGVAGPVAASLLWYLPRRAAICSAAGSVAGVSRNTGASRGLVRFGASGQASGVPGSYAAGRPCEPGARAHSGRLVVLGVIFCSVGSTCGSRLPAPPAACCEPLCGAP